MLKIDSSNSILHPGITTGLMVLKETAAISGGIHDGITDGSFVMHSANLDLSNILIRNPTFEAPHDQYTEDVMQRITSGLLIEGDLSCNSNLFIEKDVNIRGQLTVEQYQSENIITTTTSNYSFLTVAEDMSLNGRLFVRDDVSLNGSVYIDNSLGIATHRPVVAFDVSTVDAIKIPRGSTADRPETVDYEQRGYMRYNTDSSQFEGYGPGNSWISLGGAVDVDQDTFISAERGAGNDNDQLHFFTASGDTINVPHLRAVIDGSGLTIGSQLCEDVSNNVLTPTDPDFPGPRPPQDGLWVQGDASFNTLLRAQDMSVNMLQVKDASINNLGVTDLSVNDLSTNSFTVNNDASINVLRVARIETSVLTANEERLMDFGNSKIPYSYLDGVPPDSTNIESVPVGGVIMWANPNLIPIGFYMCDGGTPSGNPTNFEAPGVGTIQVPDLRGKFVVGYDSTDSLFNTVGNTGGSTQIGATQLPSHQHSGTVDSESFLLGAITGTISTENASHAHTFSANTGSDGGETVDTSQNGGHNHITLDGNVGAYINSNSGTGPLYIGNRDTGYSMGGGDHYFGTTNNSSQSFRTGNAGSHYHTVTTTDHHHSLPDTDSNNANHSHTFTSADGTGSHTHTFTTGSAYGNGVDGLNNPQQVDYYQPYYTLVYIIRYTTPLDGGNQVFGKELYYVPRQLAIGNPQTADLALDMRDCSDGILFPKGTQAQRPNFSDSTIYPDITSLQNVTGTMRYNTDIGKFEGYAGLSGNEKWGSIGGGVLDEDEDTYITAETSQGADNDQLQFFTDGTEHMRIDENGNVGIGTMINTTFTDTTLINHPTGVEPLFKVGTSTTTDYTPIAQFVTGTDGLTEINRAGIYHRRGTSYFSIYSASNNLYLHSMVSNTLIYFRIGGVNKANLNSSGQFEATSFNATSDARLKENIIPIKDPLQKINQLQGVHFNFI